MINLTGVFKMNYKDDFGYGKVANNVKQSLDLLKPNSNIEICLNIPPYQFDLQQSYKIGFTTWESTSVPDNWIGPLNSVDEIWTASSFIANVYLKYTDKPIYVFNHGLDSEYVTVKRKINKTKTILFIGDELRSNEDLVVEAYKELNINKTHSLIIKRKRPGKSINYPGITIIESLYTKKELTELMYMSDALIYPTSGEGFGLVGLEAIGTGLPIISTTEWSDYKDLITIPINSNFSDSEWQTIHPGKMYNPSIEDIKDSIINWIENYEQSIDAAYSNGIASHKRFNWELVNDKIINRIKQIDGYFA
jgi:glycosyltransferase involved in cell wall biosynthesis